MSNNPVLASTKYVVDNATHVTIDSDKLKSFFKDFTVEESENWMSTSFDLNALTDDELLMVPVVFNAISFSYWGEPYWQVTYNGTTYDRASWSLMAAILRSKEEGKSLLDVSVLQSLTRDELAYILRGNTEIPLLDERLTILRTVGTVLIEKYDGHFKNLLSQANGDALQAVDSIIAEFSPWFDDHYTYKGEEIYFNKRAQALVESVHGLLKGEGAGVFFNMNDLTALADYIIPNVLRNARVIAYSKELADVIDNGVEVLKGSEYEIEIRASVVQVMEQAREYVSLVHGNEVLTSQINDYLWVHGEQGSLPFHKTRTIAY